MSYPTPVHMPLDSQVDGVQYDKAEISTNDITHEEHETSNIGEEPSSEKGDASDDSINAADEEIDYDESGNEKCPVCQDWAAESHDTIEIFTDDLRGRSEQDCSGCSTLHEIWRHYEPWIVADEETIMLRSHYSKGKRYAVDLELFISNCVISLSAVPGTSNAHDLHAAADLALTSSERNKSLDLSPLKRLNTALDSPLSFAARSIESSITVIRNWLQSCHQTHKSCNSSTKLLLPDRILYIGGTERSKVYLKETGLQSDQYICLSYCWGAAEFFKLTTYNLAACKQGISLEDLPLAFQHAIEIARRLSIDYIWIDALCIVQDDPRDWEIQASKMAAIYQGSFLVLAMTKISSPDLDCLGEDLPTARFGSIQTYIISHLPETQPAVSSNFPLRSRAWAFQERLLAPRVLHLGQHELFWECYSLEACECGRNKDGFDTGKKAFYDIISQRSQASELGSFWRSLVDQYSGLTLTNGDDRLPALSGIATVMQSARSGTYLAGLWSDSLVLDMLWRNMDSNRKAVRSPSWSWASHNGEIYYGTKDERDTVVEAEIEGFHIEPDGVSLTGKIKSGWVELRSSVIECSSLADHSLVIAQRGRRIGSAEAGVDFWFDDVDKSRKQSPGYSFCMARMLTMIPSSQWKGFEEMVVLKAVGDLNNCYERIGYAIRMDPAPPISWPEERGNLTIV